MKNRAMRFWNLFLVVALISLPVWQMNAVGETGAAAGIDKADFAKKRIKQLQQTAQILLELAGQPFPAKLSAAEKREAERYTNWLKDSGKRLDNLADRWQSVLGKIEKHHDPVVTQKQMAEMNQSFNLQYLGLQQQMQDENRRFTLVSNIMKNKHDTAKNSINNIR